MPNESPQDELLFPAIEARDARRQRAGFYLQGLAGILILNSVLSLGLSLLFDATLPAVADVVLIASGIAVLWMVRRGHLHVARVFIAVSAFGGITLIVAMIHNQDTVQGRLVPLWFVVLAVAAYFVFYGYRALYRDLYAIAAFGMFVLYALGLGPSLPVPPLSGDLRERLDAFVAISIAVSLFAMTRLFVYEVSQAERRLGIANRRLEQILENMLPKAVADRLRAEGRAFAEPYRECSVMFADIVGFTALSQQLPADEVVRLLNSVFSRFDDLTEQAGLTKIKTIGDAYMVAAGVPSPRADHAAATASLALAFQTAIADFPGLALRAGISSGPVIGGVIGKRRLVYDLWGDTVNVAARMASNGISGRVQVTAATAQMLAGGFALEARGSVEIKGKGPMPTFLLLGPATAPEMVAAAG